MWGSDPTLRQVLVSHVSGFPFRGQGTPGPWAGLQKEGSWVKAAAASSALGESAGRWGLPLPQRLLALLRTCEVHSGGCLGTPGSPGPLPGGSDELHLPWGHREDARARVLWGEGRKDGESYTWRNLCAFSAGPYGVRAY